MFKKELPIIFIGLCMVVAVLVLGWSVFVKKEIMIPIWVPVVEDRNGEVVPDDVEDDVSDWKTYQNEEYGFEFEYPSDYTLKEVSIDYILLRRTEDEKNEWLVSVTVKHNRLGVNDSKLTFKEFAEKLAINSCPTDGPNRSIECTGITEMKSFVNKNEINGYEIYLNETTEYFPSNKISNRVKGPIFAMNISKQTNNTARSIFFDFDGKEDKEVLNEQEKQKLTNQVISTLKFTEKKDDTTNWKTYKNEKYKYEFKYPHEWNAIPNKYNTSTVLLGSEATEESSNGGIEYNGTLKQGQTFKDFVKEFSNAGLGSDFEVEKLISGYNVIVNIIPQADIHVMKETKIVSFENNREVFSLYFAYRANFGKYPEDRHKLDLFDQVVSSFKFTER